MLTTILIGETPTAVGEFDIFQNLVESRGVVLGVLIVLLAMSLICWAIIAYKWFWFRRLRWVSRRFVDAYFEAEHPNEVYDHARASEACPEGRIFVAAYKELNHLKNRPRLKPTDGFENVERAVQRAQASEITRLEQLVPFLATTGSTAPFIGLFGTVWGIMNAFAGLSHAGESANLLTTVTPHIAQALVATAIGLLAAIPAVMAYNYFVNQIKKVVSDMEGFGADYLNTLRRLFFTA